jgi:AhpD family alkylhydroperoxidase
MCCSTGVCGPEVDPALVAFAGDVKWLKAQGVTVHRYNLSQTPGVFVDNPVVYEAINDEGMDVLPLLVVDGRIVSKGRYPARNELAEIAGLGGAKPTPAEPTETLFTPQVAELVALGAAIAANCEPCFRFHYDRARKLGVSREDMIQAVNTAQAVKDTPARAVLQLAAKYLDPAPATRGGSCCGGGGSDCC